jgi:GrpB-like predicted nucleotidyltransferase (UPF0157 family)
MSSQMKLAKQAVHDKLMSQLNAAESKLIALKARAEAAKAHVEIKALGELLASKPAITRRLDQLKQSADEHWEDAKRELEGKLAHVEKTAKAIESKLKAT